MDYPKIAAELLHEVRESHPLLHHITNYVVMNDNANIALHIGAAPLMAHAVEEVEELVAIASTLIINIGTLDREWISGMEKAMHAAQKKGIPILLDPVGAGASKLRTETSIDFLESYPIRLLKGNLGEISVLAGLDGRVRGVDSQGGADPAVAAQSAAQKYATTVAVTGKEDFISDGKRIFRIQNGSEWLTTITGSGCSAATVSGAFLAVSEDACLAAVSALAIYSVAAEIAAEQGPLGPTAFKAAFFDAIYNISPEAVESRAKIEEIS